MLLDPRKALLTACAAAAVATGCADGAGTVASTADHSTAGAAPASTSSTGRPPAAGSTPAASRPTRASAPSRPAPASTTSRPAATSAVPPAAKSAAGRWARSTQFMQIREARARDGALVLTVRPARKRVLGESFETVSIPGPYTEVTVHEDAQIRTLAGTPRPHGAFSTDLAARTAQQRGEAFNVTFDEQGRAFEVDWLYRP